MDGVPISVSDTLAFINQTLETAYPVVMVEGEVSSFKLNRGKFVFFDLKDEVSSLSCFMMAWQLRLPLEDGMKVVVVAQPKLTAWGKFSLTIREVRPVGEGSLKRSFELLKQKLAGEGLFDLERKQPLPAQPVRIGVISSVESAGYIDFITIASRRWGGMTIDVANVGVQGAGAAEQMVRAIEYFNQLESPPELLVLLRGGGSADDLAVFNDEPLVRAVANSKLPIMTAIGHEVDEVLVDLAADARAATPSEAAERLTPDGQLVLENIVHTRQRLRDRLGQRLEQIESQLEAAPKQLSRSLNARLDQLGHYLEARQQILRELHPARALARGYALVRDASGHIVSEAKIGDRLDIELARSVITAGVINVSKK